MAATTTAYDRSSPSDLPAGAPAHRLAGLWAILLAVFAALAGCSGAGGSAEGDGSGGGTRGSGESDNTPPIISGVRAIPGQVSAVITWTTDEASDSTVIYGRTETLELGAVPDGRMVTEHQVQIPNLESDTTYFFKVESTDASGNRSEQGGFSFRTAATPDLTPPTIADVLVTATHDGAVVTWKTNEVATGLVDYGTTNRYGAQEMHRGFAENHQVELSGLTPDTVYHFKVTSADQANNSAATEDRTFRTAKAPDTTPPKISNVSFLLSHDAALITWDTDEVANSRVDFGETSTYDRVAGSLVAYVTKHQVLMLNLKPDTTYHFKATSADPTGNTSSTDDRTLKTKAAPDTTPPKISNVGVVTTHDTAVLTWTTDEPADSLVDYGTSKNYGRQGRSANLVTNHQIQLTGLLPNTTYHFKVTSADQAKNAASTADATFLTKNTPDTTPPKITNVQVAVTHDTATVTWTTDEPANSRVDYGTTPSYTSGNRTSASFVLSHRLQLVGLTPSTTYHFKVTSADARNNAASTPDATFKTDDRPSQNQRSSISQFGITWTFDKNYEVGQFANGDWWVLGPVKITKIDPPSVSGSRVKNGSMINPSPTQGQRQGYDSSMRDNVYTAALNVALDVSASRPLIVPPDSSLVSTISVEAAAHRPQIKGCSILTVLQNPAQPGDFRPAYCGKVKTPKFNQSRLNRSLLRQLKRTPSAPSMTSVADNFERPWLDHSPNWTGREYHPEDNMPDYGRDMSSQIGVAALMLHTDFSMQEKETLLRRFVQLGIDFQGIVDDGGLVNWVNNGGHASGRKWPILFAGLMLNDATMKGVGSNKAIAFGEDQQTFIVTETSPGVFNKGYGGYSSAHRGMAEWGINHATRPQRDDISWSAKYRQCCTANAWNGFILSAYIMGAKGLWNHDPLFAYQDRYISESRAKKDPTWMLSWNDWAMEMWDAYRSNY